MTNAEQLVSALADRYRIERELGAGGMATVYLAEDLKHKRAVAVKVLRPELAAVIGADRFLTEITTTASLQHPHILPLHDSGEADGFLFYVMPFIEGETVRDRLNREKQLPVPDALRIAAEVAAALDYAHRRGIIHRDIKPENILLHDGSALVADFGIALAASRAGDTRMTETGMSLGTPHYMSPEQAMGDREITARTDVYALGCVVYEMLLGEPPFTGPTAQSVVAKVLTEKPASLTLRRERVPISVEHAVLTALEKLPADRHASAAAFAAALAEPGASPVPATGLFPKVRRITPRAWLAAAALVVVVMGGTAWATRDGFRTAPGLVMSSLMPSGNEHWLRRGDGIALSPDGRVLAVVAMSSPDARGVLALRRMDRLTIDLIRGTEGARWPFWSPDGRSLGFFTDGQLKRLDLATGRIRELCAAPAPHGGTWGTKGDILFTTVRGRSLRHVRAEGGECTEMKPARDDRLGGRPYFLADGTHYVIAGYRSTVLAELGSDAETILLDTHWSLSVLALPDMLLWSTQEGDLIAQRIDARQRRLVGEPARMLDVVETPFGYTTLSASEFGSLVVAGPEGSVHNVMLFAERGSLRGDTLPLSESYWRLRVSHAGDRLALSGFGVAIFDLATRTLTVMPDAPDGRTVALAPLAWSPEDTAVVQTAADRLGATMLFRLRGELWTEAWQPPGPGGRATTVVDWSRDGRWLLLSAAPGPDDPYTGIWIQDTRDGSMEPLIAELRDVGSAIFSPDIRFIAYTAIVSDESQVYIRAFPGPGPAIRVSAAEGANPRWRGDSRELFYSTADRRIMAVPIAPDGTAGEARLALDNEILRGATEFTGFDVLPDGQSFVMRLAVGGTKGFTLVNNWPALMRSRD